MRMQGYNANGDVMSSMFVEKPRDVVDAATGEMVPFDTGLSCDPREGMTRQEFAEECDINNLMARYEVTGQLPFMRQGAPDYLDVSEVPDLATAMQVVNDANRAFMTLPAKVRAEFENDPVKFVAYAQDPENVDQMRKWGLAAPAPVEEPPMKVEVVNAAVDEKAAK